MELKDIKLRPLLDTLRLEKIKSMYINKYDDLDDLLDYDDFCIELAEKHGIYLGDVSEINEFM